MEAVQLNKLALLSDHKQIFFSHADGILEAFREIETLNNEVILISGGGDAPGGLYEEGGEAYINTNTAFTQMPKNLKYWFAQNNITKKENIIPLPIGIQNSFSVPNSPGFDWIDPTILPKVFMEDTTKPTRSFYLNYCNRRGHRIKVTKMCEKYLDITYHTHTKIRSLFSRHPRSRSHYLSSRYGSRYPSALRGLVL